MTITIGLAISIVAVLWAIADAPEIDESLMPAVRRGGAGTNDGTGTERNARRRAMEGRKDAFLRMFTRDGVAGVDQSLERRAVGMIQEIELVGGAYDGLIVEAASMVPFILKVSDAAPVTYRYERTVQVTNGRRVFFCPKNGRTVSPSVIKH